MKVLEIDQWSSTGDIEKFGFDDFDLKKLSGGGVEAAIKIFGGYYRIFDASENDVPELGTAWFIENPETKKFELYKTNYDTSD